MACIPGVTVSAGPHTLFRVVCVSGTIVHTLLGLVVGFSSKMFSGFGLIIQSVEEMLEFRF